MIFEAFKRLRQLGNELCQTRLITIGILAMNKIATCGPIEKSGHDDVLFGGGLFARFSAEFPHGATQVRTVCPIPDSSGLGSFYPLGAGFVIRQVLSFQSCSSYLAFKYMWWN